MGGVEQISLYQMSYQDPHKKPPGEIMEQELNLDKSS